ncbi:D-alanyl-D-alanine carboxypeptidase/D-alanyl-D-alanine-endopeptidase [Rhodoflexus caldus]|uniref:D-alanyl-D-alanine carboxypeptidase/D-alanyl-D-alanine-endopeptidase n=1 Tax=Rhodoflexus caldus TaxID=2891236 RepID=UPI002029EDA1|nr:D-alanyl-D-alanine carboxypeptidase [Rhodoflexus caldus]
MMKIAHVGIGLLLIAAACTPRLTTKSMERQAAKNKNYEQSFHGLAVYDIAAEKYLIEYNSRKYFTPASNTKLFTFYAGLQLLGDKIPALRYVQRGDSLIIWGTGDPSQLHPLLKSRAAIDFLQQAQGNIYFSPANFTDERLGLGWAWNDYLYGYQPEKSPMPLYGNYVQFIKKDKQVQIIPAFFASLASPDKELLIPVTRGMEDNLFRYNPTTLKEEETPFYTSAEFTARLLTDTLKKPVRVANITLPDSGQWQTVWGIATDELYRPMLQESDNFFAEHILLLCAGNLRAGSFTLRSDKVINHLLKNQLADLSDKPRWVDGSGLSRYNLFTPRNCVELLQKIYKQVAKDSLGEQRLFSLLPQAGKSGTLRNVKVYPPSVYAKTGSLSNNHNLSGFLITRSGRRLIFSFQNNHFMIPTATIREEMGKILWQLYEQY